MGNSTEHNGQQSSSYQPTLHKPQGTVIGDNNQVHIHFEAPASQAEQKTPASELTEDELVRIDRLYREQLLQDIEISSLQVLGMSNPLDIMDIYVRVHLHRDPRPRFSLPEEQTEQQDPLSILQQRERWLEQRKSTAFDPAVALKQYQRCVVIGDPGAGKTTLLKRLALQALRQEKTGLPTIPILIRLHEAAQDLQWHDLLEFVLASWEQQYGLSSEQFRPWLKARLQAGKAMLLLDALDEAIIGTSKKEADQSYQRVQNGIMNLIRRFPQAPIMVTARKAGYFKNSQLTGFTELEVLDFLPHDIEQFVRKWFEHYGQERRNTIATSLLADLKKHPRIETLAANPLLLTLIVITYESNAQQLPENRAQLYKECIDTLLQRWDGSRQRSRYHYIASDRQKRLLTRIAYHFHQRRQRYFAQEELLVQINDFLDDLGESYDMAEAILREITGENGVLCEQANHVYGFLHLTLQEYLTAEYFSQHSQQIISHLGDPWWEEVILLLVGQLDDAGPLLQHLLTYRDDNDIPEDIFASKLLLAGRCLATRPVIKREYAALREEIPQRLLDNIVNAPYKLVRQQSANVLAEIGRSYPSNSFVVEWLRLLSTEQPEQQEIALNAIAYSGLQISAIGHAGIQYASDRLLRFAAMYSWSRYREDIREQLNTIFLRLCDETMIPHLHTILEDDREYDQYPLDIEEIVLQIEGENGFLYLRHLLKKDDLSIFRKANILRALINSASNNPALPEILWKQLANPELAYISLYGLMQSEQSTEDLTPYIIQKLQDPESSVHHKYPMLTTLATHPEKVTIDQLLPLLMEDSKTLNHEIKGEIIDLLIRFGSHTTKEHLRAWATEQQNIEPSAQWIFQYLILAIGKYEQSKDTLPLLYHYRSSLRPDSDHQTAITLALAHQGDVSARQTVIDNLNTFEEDYPTQYIADMLIKHAPLFQQLELIANPNIRRTLRTLLAEQLQKEIGIAENLPVQQHILQLIQHQPLRQELRAALIRALGQYANTKEIADTLVALLPTSDLADDIHTALYYICRRTGITIIDDNTQLHIIPRP